MRLFSPLLFAVALSAQIRPVPYAAEMGPLFSVKSVHLQYPETYRSIKDVDFGNTALQLDGIRLKNGHYELMDRQKYQFDLVELSEVHYIGPATALVTYYRASGGGSTNNTGLAQVNTLSNHRLAITQRITWDEDARGGSEPSYRFDAATNTLFLRSSHYLSGDAHCCISAVDVVTFVWTGKQFQQRSVRTELSAYGRREGRSLPR